MKFRPRPRSRARHLALPRRLGWALVVGCWLGLTAAPALAQGAAALPPLAPLAPLAPHHLAQALQLAAHAAQTLAQTSAPVQARVVVTPGQLDPRLKLAPCGDIQAFMPAGVPAWGRSRVGLRCAKGPAAWQVYLPIQVDVWAQAPVLAQALPAGTALLASMLSTAEVNWAASTTPPNQQASSLVGRVLARPVAAGQALWATDLKTRQWFSQGESVRIVAQGSGFAISAEGTALGVGLEGQSVRVKTESGRIITAWPVGERRVELSL